MGRRRKTGERYPGGKLKPQPKVPEPFRRPFDIRIGNKGGTPAPVGSVAVYVMAAGSATKIGLSRNPRSRARNIQVGHDLEVRLVWAVRLHRADAALLERETHRYLRTTPGFKRGEWYSLSADTAIEAIRAQIKRLGLQSTPDLEVGHQG